MLLQAEDPEEAARNQSLSVAFKVLQGTPPKLKQNFALGDLSSGSSLGILGNPPKSSFKRLILETLLWQGAMSSSLKSPPKGLKNTECKKGTPPVRPLILYVPSTNLHKKQETEQIKVKLPDGTKFQMPTYGTGNNEEYLVHIITVL